MNIINKVTDESYTQWIEDFIKRVIKRAKLECDEVIIDYIEFSKRIYLTIDNENYCIRTWNFHCIKTDSENRPCSELVDYTLFKSVKDTTGSHGVEVCNGELVIEWSND